jgi:hypothetical protein
MLLSCALLTVIICAIVVVFNVIWMLFDVCVYVLFMLFYVLFMLMFFLMLFDVTPLLFYDICMSRRCYFYVVLHNYDVICSQCYSALL